MSLPANRRVRKFTYALQERQSVTLDSNGAGTIRFAPGGARERWLVTLINVQCTQLTLSKVPTCLLYRGAPTPAYQIGGTYTGSFDTDSTDQFLMNMNEDLYAVFSGGDPTAVGTVRLEGTRYVWSK